MTRLQSDSAFLGTSATFPTGTYTALTLTYNPPTGVFSNDTSGTIAGCPPGFVCTLPTGTAGSIQVSLSPSLTITSGEQLGLALDFNFNNAITSASGISIDPTQPNVLTVATLPQTGTLDLIEDFTGKVTVVSGNNVTIVSGTRGTLTATANSSTVYNGLQGICSAADFSCVAINRTVSVDAALNRDGTLTLLEVDLLDNPSVDEVEGTVFVTGVSGQFGLIVSDKTIVSGNTSLAAAVAGSGANVTMSTGTTFAVDTKNLPVTPGSGFLGEGDLVTGQTVMVRVTAATTSSGMISATVDRVVLRYTRVTGTVSGPPGSSAFAILDISLPPFFQIFVSSPAVQTYPTATTFEGGGITNISGLSAGNTVSIRALLLNPVAVPQAFLAAKVRKH